MPLSSALQTKFEKIITDVASDIAPRQIAYKAVHGRFWQGILTPSVLPKDGVTRAPDKTLKPSDQDEDWNDFGAVIPTAVECSFAVDIYGSDADEGYIVRGEGVEKTKPYKRCLNVGPDASRELLWTEILAIDYRLP